MIQAYVCCFCGEPIGDADEDAVQLIATNLWKRDAAQALYAHSACGLANITKGQFSPDLLHDRESGYTLEEIVWGDNEAKHVPIRACLAAILVLAFVGYGLYRIFLS